VLGDKKERQQQEKIVNEKINRHTRKARVSEPSEIERKKQRRESGLFENPYTQCIVREG